MKYQGQVVFGVVLVATLLATGCGVVEEKRQAYRASESIAPLQLPDSLDSPVSNEALLLPELQQSRLAADAPPFNTRPPAPANLPVEVKPAPTPESKSETKE